MVSLKNNYIFVHIPKCAGTSIENALIKHEDLPLDLDELFLPNPKGIPKSHSPFKKYYEVPQHYTLQTIYEILCSRGLKSFFNDAIIFAVVREPYSRLRSSSHYLTKTFQSEYTIASLLRHENIGNHRFDLNQYDWLTVDGECMVDKIIKFENLESGVKDLSKLLSINLVLPKHKHESTIYSSEFNDDSRVKSIVNKRYNIDYKKFKYEYTT